MLVRPPIRVDPATPVVLLVLVAAIAAAIAGARTAAVAANARPSADRAPAAATARAAAVAVVVEDRAAVLALLSTPWFWPLSTVHGPSHCQPLREAPWPAARRETRRAPPIRGWRLEERTPHSLSLSAAHITPRRAGGGDDDEEDEDEEDDDDDDADSPASLVPETVLRGRSA